MADMDSLAELETWLNSLDAPRFPTEAEIDVWDFLCELDELDRQARARGAMPPDGGDAISIFCEETP